MINQARNAPQSLRETTGTGWSVMSIARRTRRDPVRRGPALLLVAVFLATASPSLAQDTPSIAEAVTVEDLGLTMRLATGARAAAMAGTYTAIGDDAQALAFNPAGLARLRRIELAVGFQHQNAKLDNEFYGSNSSVDVSSTDLDHVTWAYPVPTYRGSFVLAAGVFRTMTSDIDILNRGSNTTTQSVDDYRLQQSGSVYSYNFGFAIDLAPVVSFGANFFFLDGGINALTQVGFVNLPPVAPGEPSEVSVVDNADVDVDGYGASFGIQYAPVSVLNFGVVVRTPTPINLSGRAITETAEYYTNDTDQFYTDSFVINTDYQLPFRVEGGVGLKTHILTVAVEAGYTDWTQTKINDIPLKDQNLRPIFRETVDLRGGAEVLIPGTTVHARAGYALLPYALQYLQADRIANSGQDLEKSTIVTERQLISAGLGVVLGRALAVDAALEYQLGEREIPTLVDKRKAARFVMSASYRF